MKPNDKVVCVDDNFHGAITDPAFDFVGPIPKKDSVYTVEKVMQDDEGVKSLRLTGATVFYNATRGRIETGFRAVRFRKLDEVKQEVMVERRVPVQHLANADRLV